MHNKQLMPDSSAVRVALWRALHVQGEAPPHVLEENVGIAPGPGRGVVASSGVSMSLTHHANVATLRQLAALDPGSRVAMGFMLPLELVEAEERGMRIRAEEVHGIRDAVHQLLHGGPDAGLGPPSGLQKRSGRVRSRPRAA